MSEAADDELVARWDKLANIAFRGRKGEVEGVAFDLTFHPDFEWSKWDRPRGLDWLNPAGLKWQLARPWIVWPWNKRPLAASELRAEAAEILADRSSPGGDPAYDAAWVDDYIARGTPDIEIVAGDQVIIGRIVTNIKDDFLRAPESVDTLNVYLTVHRATGEVVELATPLEYLRFGHLDVAADFLPIQMELRLARRLGLTNEGRRDAFMDEMLLGNREATLNEEAYLAISHSNDQLAAVLDRLREHLPSEEVDDLCRRVKRVAGDFAGAGYALAQAESEAYAVPLAERALASKAGTDAGAAAKRKSGDPVREAARAYILANPRTSQTACVVYVAAKMGKDESSVRRAIAGMFEPSGRGREKRPIPEE